ncbi:ribosome biogenesis protein ytm1 [Orbilia javanica]|uniref:Ribosome biogenesis protein YTM1 n=1 Tax=Orbilia javanica TaxID=47235 RepID=A0AAN8NP23_9PEZI
MWHMGPLSVASRSSSKFSNTKNCIATTSNFSSNLNISNINFNLDFNFNFNPQPPPTMSDTMDIDGPSSSSFPKIQINLSTRDTTLSIPLQPLRIPTNLKRYGLSTLVNHLLETPKPIPFDFLIDGKYLRTSIDEYLTEAGLSSEKPLDVEYVRSQLPPTYIGSFEQDDWISSVHISSSSTSTAILTGSFNGTAQITSLSGDVLARTVPMHTQSVKSATWISQPRSGTSSSEASFLTAGLDRTINLWSYTPSENPSETLQVSPTISFISHKSTVNSLSYSPSTSQFLSSSSDNTVALWSTDPSLLPTVTAPQSTAFARKRRRTSTKPPSTIKKGPLAVLTPHTAPVSQAIHSTDPTAAYSVSWDKSIITHDLVTSQTVSTRTTQHPLLSVTTLPALNLLAAGSAARHITLHDPRESSRTVQTAVLRGHTNGVVSLVRSPESEYVFASGSHDGTVRIWDVRGVSSTSDGGDDGEGKSGGSLFVIKRESGTGKVFGVDWSRDVGLVSVGEDKKIQINRGEGMMDVTVMDQS